MEKRSKEEKVSEYIEKHHDEMINIPEESREIKITIPGKPESYARPRSGRGHHFYNPKEGKMKSCRIICMKQLNEEDKEFVKDAVENYQKNYYVEMDVVYYYKIPQGNTIKESALKKSNILKATVKQDLDNFDKFLLDSLHEVLYDDDKHVVKIKSEKRYDFEPRTELTAKITKIKL